MYPYYEKLIGSEFPIALGGYPALVRQGIIKDSRSSGDVDLCIFENGSDPSQNRLMGSLLNSVFRWNTFFRRIGQQDNKFYFDIQKSKASSDSEYSDEQIKSIKKSIGVDKSITLSLAMNVDVHEMRRASENKKRVHAVKSALSEAADFNWTISQGQTTTTWNDTQYITIPSGDGVYIDMGRRENSKRPVLNNEKGESAMIAHVAKMYPLEDAIMFNQMILGSGGYKIDFDLFYMDIKRMKRSTVVIDDVRYVNYYVILKAKYEYCMNRTMGEESFVKHMRDLEESYGKVRIAGVNSPKDLDFLTKNRLSEK